MIVVELSSMETGECCTTGDEKSNLDCLLVPEEAMGVVTFTEWSWIITDELCEGVDMSLNSTPRGVTLKGVVASKWEVGTLAFCRQFSVTHHLGASGGGNNVEGEEISLVFDLKPPAFVDSWALLSSFLTSLLNSVKILLKYINYRKTTSTCR